jgi:hypothetical protein
MKRTTTIIAAAVGAIVAFGLAVGIVVYHRTSDASVVIMTRIER